MSKYTPAPWHFDSENGRIANQEDHAVAYIAGARPERLENGNVIAAAPELLEALHDAQQEFLGLSCYLATCDNVTIVQNLDSVIASLKAKQAKAEAAIKKARGE